MAIEQNHRVKTGQVMGLGDFARLIGRSENYVRECIQNGMPVAERGDRGTSWRIETGPAIWWMMQWAVMQADGAERRNTRDPKTRREIAQAELAEMQVAVKRGELAPVDMMQQGLELVISRARARLLSIPQKCAGMISGGMKTAEVKQVLEDQVHSALNELAGAEISLATAGENETAEG